jgi:hypothetical protein
MPFSVDTRIDPSRPWFRRAAPSTPRPALRRAAPGSRPVARLKLAGLWLLLITTVNLGCASKSCEGDACPTVCSDSSCNAGALCVNGLCRPECSSDAICLAGDTCRRLRTDFGSEGSYCYGPALASNPYQTASSSRPGNSAGVATNAPAQTNSEVCKQNSDCKSSIAQACVQGMCLTTCQTHLHCGTAGECTGTVLDVEGNPAHYCKPDTFPRAAGQYGTSCFQDTEVCDAEQGFFCLGSEGEADSICTQAGCDRDQDCPSGFFCGLQRSGRSTCEATCGSDLQARDANCVAASDIGPGRPYRCHGSIAGLEHAACLPRAFCNACETDADCAALPNQICAKGPDGQRSCTEPCTPGKTSCPWGGATDCKVYDAELGRATCGHRFGKCEGTGHGCEPCIDDRSCPNGFCATSTYSGERFCVDLIAACSCEPGDSSCSGGGCEKSPSGLAQQCLSRGENEAPSVCFGSLTRPKINSSPIGCWLAPVN